MRVIVLDGAAVVSAGGQAPEARAEPNITQQRVSLGGARQVLVSGWRVGRRREHKSQIIIDCF